MSTPRWAECPNCLKWHKPNQAVQEYCGRTCAREHQAKMLNGEDRIAVLMRAIEAEIRKQFK